MNSTDAVKTNTPKKKSWTIIALLTVSIFPIIAAYTMFYTGMGVPDHTVNTGVLLSKAVKVQDLLGATEPDFVQALQTNKKWRLLIPITTECNKACEQNFYTTRQVHIRLSEKSSRVERIAVNVGGTVGQRIYDQIKAEHPNLKLVNADSNHWVTWLGQSESGLDATQNPFYLLIDQEGFAMMSYTTAQHGNELLKDIKRALKYSIDYQ